MSLTQLLSVSVFPSRDLENGWRHVFWSQSLHPSIAPKKDLRPVANLNRGGRSKQELIYVATWQM
jgi:hypothetical protein